MSPAARHANPSAPPPAMAACRIVRFGGPEVIEICEIPRPTPGAGEVLVRVEAAGVGPWDALIRSGRSALVTGSSLPVTLGSDLAGVVEAVGTGVTHIAPGEAVYGVTNGRFIGACADYALAEAGRLARKPARLDFIAAAAMPVVAVTAWQMLFDHGRLQPGQSVLVLGGNGSVGGCAIELARSHGARVVATSAFGEVETLRRLGAHEVIDLRSTRIETLPLRVDVVIDTAGGVTQQGAWPLLKRGGAFVSVVSAPDAARASDAGARSVFFYVDVRTARLDAVGALLEKGALTARVGSVLPLCNARQAHEMLAGFLPRAAGKIVLAVGG